MTDFGRILVNNAEVAYRETGSGEPVVYLHGFPTSGHLWRRVVEVVGSEYRAIAPDLPGFGDSDLLSGAHTWEALVFWTDEWVNQMDLGPVHLGVHDWGGMIGLAWACQHPEKVRSLLITDTSFRSKDRWHAFGEQLRTPGLGEEMIGDMTEEGFAGLLAAGGLQDPPTASEYWKAMSTLERRAAKLEMYRSLDFIMLEPLEVKLPEVAPGRCRVVWGGQDVFVPPKVGIRLAERMGTEATVLENAGHFLQEDAGDELGRLHLEFLKGL